MTIGNICRLLFNQRQWKKICTNKRRDTSSRFWPETRLSCTTTISFTYLVNQKSWKFLILRPETQYIKDHAIFDEKCSLFAEYVANGFPNPRKGYPLKSEATGVWKTIYISLKASRLKERKCWFPKLCAKTHSKGCIQHTKESLACSLNQVKDSSGQAFTTLFVYSEITAVNATNKHHPNTRSLQS